MSKRKKSSNLHSSDRSKYSLASASPFNVTAGVALIALAVLLAYLPSLGGGFLWDDESLVPNNRLLRSSSGLYDFWCTTKPPDFWPITNTAFWIQWRMWATHPAGYHFSNLILHIAESLLIWTVLRKLSIPGAFLAALIFAVHPVNVQSVAWISQLKNTMAMLFFLLSILWYLKGMQRPDVQRADSQRADAQRAGHFSDPVSTGLCTTCNGKFYWLSLAAFVLAMLGKGSVAVLPMLLLGLVWWLRPLTRRDFVQIAPFFLIAAALTCVNIYFQTYVANVGIIRTADFMQRLLGAGAVVWFYLYKALLPVNLLLIYPQWEIKTANWLWWLPLLAAVALTAVLWWYRKSWSRPVLFAWGFFCVTLAPVMGFTDVGFMRIALVSDHYLHIALVGVIALAAAFWSVWRRQASKSAHAAAVIVAALAVCNLTILTSRQSSLYRDPVTMYRAVLEKNPECWVACDNLGEKLIDSGHTQEAIKLLEHALRIKPDSDDAHRNLGNALAKVQRLPEAIEQFKQAIRFRSDSSLTHMNYGSALDKAGRKQEAIAQYRQALRLDPDSISIYNNLALLYVGMRQPDDAIAAAQKALDIARSQEQTALAKSIEDWINSYRARLSKFPPVPPDSK
jgi:protein O-mannosyl-transferase